MIDSKIFLKNYLNSCDCYNMSKEIKKATKDLIYKYNENDLDGMKDAVLRGADINLYKSLLLKDALIERSADFFVRLIEIGARCRNPEQFREFLRIVKDNGNPYNCDDSILADNLIKYNALLDLSGCRNCLILTCCDFTKDCILMNGGTFGE